tara:strand:- start:129 stop:344 length:216 start_codon:yes stop_codon:yes gene_type:complete
MYIRIIPNKIIKNKIISTQKRKIMKFQNITALGLDTSYAYLLLVHVSFLFFLASSLEFVYGNLILQTKLSF